MAGESNFGTPLQEARLGNPLLYARRVFIAIISSFFCQEYLPSYQNAPRNPYLLRCDEDGGISNDSGIFITDRFSEEDVARRPQIVVGRGPAVWGDIAIGDKGQGVGTNSGAMDRNKIDTFSFPIELSVYAQNDIEAENIAWAVAYCIKAFEREIRIGSLIYQLDSTSIGPTELSKVSSEVEQFRVTLQTRVTLVVRWLKSTTLTKEQIQQGFCKISGDPYPMTIADLCIFGNPVDKPEGW